MKTLFLNPPHPLEIKLDIQRYTLRTRAGSLFPPVWLSWAAASVPDSRVVDSMASNLRMDEVASIARDYDLIVMQVDTATINPCLQVAEYMKESTGAKICFVGPHVSVQSCANDVLNRGNNVDYVARREYDYILNTFDVTKPFSNIITSEETHISLLLPLFETYSIDLPLDTSDEHVITISSLEEAFNIGVYAEIMNIDMYNLFLEQDNLPDDVRDVFIKLRDASLNHLSAFEKNAAK